MKTYFCTICQKSFSNRSVIRNHIKRNHGIRSDLSLYVFDSARYYNAGKSKDNKARKIIMQQKL